MHVVRRQLLIGLLVAGVVWLGVVISPGRALGVVEWSLASPWFPAILVVLYLIRPLVAWPITALSVLVGFRYGLVVGLPVALAGVVVTSLIPYAVARYSRSDVGLLGRATEYSERFFDTTGDLRGVIAARLAPTPAEVISLGAGAGRVSIPAFVVGTAVGELPWTIAAVVAGESMQQLVIAEASPAPWLLVGGVLGAGVLLAGPVVRALRDRSSKGI